MAKHTAENERIKRAYFRHLKVARGLSEPPAHRKTYLPRLVCSNAVP
jgi:hypothetical protein